MMKKNNWLLSLFLFAGPLTLAANDNAIQDPFAPQPPTLAVADAGLNCSESSEWLMDTLPLAELKPVGLIQYGKAETDAVVLWLTANGVIIDSRLNHVIAQEQWQIVQIETQRIRLQQCGNPSQLKTIHL